jgi:hypothetical protein
VANDLSQILSAYCGSSLIGFLHEHGNVGVETFTQDKTSIGIFPTTTAAANATSDVAEFPAINITANALKRARAVEGEIMSAPSQWKPIGSGIAPPIPGIFVPCTRGGRKPVISAGEVAGEGANHEPNTARREC